MREDFNEAEIAIAYDVARQVARGERDEKEAKAYLLNTIRAAGRTANSYIKAYERMLSGTAYDSALGLLATEFFVRKIGKELGLEARKLALQSVLANIEFYENSRGSKGRKPANRREHRQLHTRLIAERMPDEMLYPDEVPLNGKQYVEGAVTTITVNRYERSPEAREKCIAHYGCRCVVCGADFEQRYGTMGKGFIHVHHVVDIATIGVEYTVDPVKDLRPVCPNCHAMLHTRKPAISVEELRSLFDGNIQGTAST